MRFLVSYKYIGKPWELSRAKKKRESEDTFSLNRGGQSPDLPDDLLLLLPSPLPSRNPLDRFSDSLFDNDLHQDRCSDNKRIYDLSTFLPHVRTPFHAAFPAARRWPITPCETRSHCPLSGFLTDRPSK